MNSITEYITRKMVFFFFHTTIRDGMFYTTLARVEARRIGHFSHYNRKSDVARDIVKIDMTIVSVLLSRITVEYSNPSPPYE